MSKLEWESDGDHQFTNRKDGQYIIERRYTYKGRWVGYELIETDADGDEVRGRSCPKVEFTLGDVKALAQQWENEKVGGAV